MKVVPKLFLFHLVVFMASSAFADIASTTYVDSATQNKLDISATANQKIEGTYTLSGQMYVPTPPLPAIE